MTSRQKQFHIFFLPFMAPGHMLPTMDMARLFATRGIKSTIVTTPANETFFPETQNHDTDFNLLTIKFPPEVGVPKGCENAEFLTSTDMFRNLFTAIDLLQEPLASLLDEFKPNCLIADEFIHWANSVAAKFGIPCLSFHGSSYFSRCISRNIYLCEPYRKLSSDSETFIVPGDLPHEIRLTKSELSPYEKQEGPKFLLELMDSIRVANRECYGVIMNSFYELEPEYADYYEKVTGMKHWHIGPFSLGCKPGDDRGGDHRSRGKSFSIDVSECKRWLDEKEVDSVIYICLGSMSNVSNAQLYEIAIALEALGQNFILVVRKGDNKEWAPDGFEAVTKEKGLVIEGWAPQTMILDHPSVGVFMTHCGWNSILEGVVAGVPMVTWPLHAEQFYNEKLITDVLNIGIEVGSKKWVPRAGNHDILISNKDILKAMTRVMVGDEGRDMRKRVKEYKEMAKKSTSQGGSSCNDLSALIQDLKAYKDNGELAREKTPVMVRY